MKPLENRTILVTRPKHQSAHLAQLIRAAGGAPLLFPVIEIEPIDESEQLAQQIDALDQCDLAVFVSANAAREGLAAIRTRRELPPKLRVVAVGPGTAKALQSARVENVIAPSQRFDTEGLLDLPEFRDSKGKRIVIFRGEGGRELLGETLRAQGAAVTYAECYRRRKPRTDAAALNASLQHNQVDAITVSSSEGLRTLCDLVGIAGDGALKSTPLFVPHERIAQTAASLAFATVVRTPPGDAGLARGLAAWFAAKLSPTAVYSMSPTD